LVRRPALFLLDEPLSNLDAKLRTSTRTELKRLQRELGITTIYVTHDQVEAMTLGDRVALLRDGAIVQVGTPQALYDRPATPFAASFVGSPPMNLLAAKVAQENKDEVVVEVAATSLSVPRDRVRGETRPGAAAQFGIRPEDLALADTANEAQERAPGASLRGRVTAIESLGREYLLHVEVGGQDVLVLAPAAGRGGGESAALRFDPAAVHVFTEVESGFT
jgi:multiple sugar transport system ATP-binding protein